MKIRKLYRLWSYREPVTQENLKQRTPAAVPHGVTGKRLPHERLLPLFKFTDFKRSFRFTEN